MIARFAAISAAVVLLSACAFAQQSSSPSPDATALTATAALEAAAAGAEPVGTAGTADAGADAAAAPVPVVPVAESADAYRIGPEDVLDFHVWKNDELSRRVPVRPDGRISLPLVNDIQAAGLTPNELRGRLTEALSRFIQNPEVSVIVLEVHSRRVSVQGNVRMPNQYEVRSQATVLDMISRAQGFNEFADKNGVVVLRRSADGGEQRIRFDYKKALEGREGANFFVQPGDIIHVP